MCVHSMLAIISLCVCLLITYERVFENKDFCSLATQIELDVQDLSLHGKKRPPLEEPHLSLFSLS